MESANMKKFRELIKSLPEGQRARLPEKIRELTNRLEHTNYLEAIVLGVVLELDNEISLTGYMHVPADISLDEQYCTAIKDCNTEKMIVGEDCTETTMSIQDFKKKILYA